MIYPTNELVKIKLVIATMFVPTSGNNGSIIGYERATAPRLYPVITPNINGTSTMMIMAGRYDALVILEIISTVPDVFIISLNVIIPTIARGSFQDKPFFRIFE